MKERTASRGGPRLELALKGTLHVGDPPNARVLALVTRDLGAGGAHVSLAEVVPVGTRALLRLAVPADQAGSPSLEFRCHVVRVDGQGPAEVALAFDEKKGPVLESLKK
ncbi:MAG TPA: PilZ domain-containing protein, partial [Candidatus Polarisedimenticolia bacterium]|nr:PilZ domain-containing protein [Candidatus Polarisedimenticolia bacterium]